MTANELDIKVMEYVHKYDVNPVLQRMQIVGEGQILEVKNENPRGCNLYHQWLACLIRYIKPMQVLELGASIGISTVMISIELPIGATLYSVDDTSDYKEGPKTWACVDQRYTNVVKILGDTRDIKIWTPYTELLEGDLLVNTDIWFFDSLHTEDQLRAELEVYTPFFKKGAILVFDDIHLNPGMEKVWNELPYDKQDISNPCHWSGFGVAII